MRDFLSRERWKTMSTFRSRHEIHPHLNLLVYIPPNDIYIYIYIQWGRLSLIREGGGVGGLGLRDS